MRQVVGGQVRGSKAAEAVAARRGSGEPGLGRRYVLVLLLAAALLPILPTLASASEAGAAASPGDYKCVNEGRVYLGNARLFKAPAHIDSNRVYRQIAEYREILEKGLTDRDVHYHVLMKKVAARFAEAVKAMARNHKHDLVAEVGAIEKARGEASDVPDRTDAAIAALG